MTSRPSAPRGTSSQQGCADALGETRQVGVLLGRLLAPYVAEIVQPTLMQRAVGLQLGWCWKRGSTAHPTPESEWIALPYLASECAPAEVDQEHFR